MFNFVHHVRILVHNADDMVRYMEENFAMEPVKIQVYEQRGMKNAIYQVGHTNLEFTEPLDPGSKMAQFLEHEGPSVYHIAFGVDNIIQAAKDLASNGTKMMGHDGLTQSAEGYMTANIDPDSALGFPFQLAEG